MDAQLARQDNIISTGTLVPWNQVESRRMSLNRQKMNPAVKLLWLEALRSGNYRLGVQSLRRKIFVVWAFSLCDLGVQEGIIPPPHIGPYLNDTYRYAGVTGGLPGEVKQWAGIETCAGYFLGYDNRFRTLAEFAPQARLT